MGHIHHKLGPDGVGDLAHPLEVDLAAVGGGAADDQLGPLPLGDAGHLVIVDQFVVLAHRVGDRVEPLAGLVGGAAVGQVTAGGEVHAEEGVAGPQHGHEHRLVGLGAGVRLHVGEGTAEQLLGPLDGQPLGLVYIFAPAVVAPPRVAFGVFVGEHAALRLQHGAGDDVLRGDQLDLLLLPLQLALDGGVDFRVGPDETIGEEAALDRGSLHGGGVGRGQGEASNELRRSV